MQTRLFLFSTLTLLSLGSCVSSKKFKSAQADYQQLESKYKTLEGDMNECATEKATLARQKEACEREKALMATKITELGDQVEFLKQNNNQAIKQLETMSVISSQQAESIRKSMD
ncbi:MAG: hypothetical protein RLZZ256_246, partial [Bacteroidota bacterium]